MSTGRQNLLAALVGVVAAVVTLGVAEVVTLLVAPGASPLAAVGGFVIDIVPAWVKDAAIALFGTSDKLALLISLALLVLVLALGAGVLQYRRPPLGAVVLAVVALVAIAAAVTRAAASPAWAVPTLLGAGAGIVILVVGTRRLRAFADAPTVAAEGVSRRRFVGLIAASAASAAVVGVAARTVNAATTAVSTAREKLVIPPPSVSAPPVPAAASLDIEGIAPLFTPNDEFYRIDTALQVPVVNTDEWRLRITGMVEQEVEVTLDELLALPLIETAVTLACVSNEVGGSLIGNALWTGYPIRSLLARARPTTGADMVLSRSVDGFTASSPLEVLTDDRDAIFAVSMNGEPLPLEHGFPVRMVVPGLYGYVSATKWVTELRVTRFADETAYWTTRGWDERGPIKTSSRIDVPRGPVSAGTVAVAGVAWAQHTGIEAVEVRVDDGPWQAATLAEAVSADTWRQWYYSWDAAPGSYQLQARATDAAGRAQSGRDVFVAPNGAEGYHTVDVTVS